MNDIDTENVLELKKDFVNTLDKILKILEKYDNLKEDIRFIDSINLLLELKIITAIKKQDLEVSMGAKPLIEYPFSGPAEYVESVKIEDFSENGNNH